MHALRPKRRLSAAFARNPADNIWLDCLRTIAVALVVMRHGQRVFETGHDATFLETLMINGWAGVDLFFLLSGYLVTAGLLKHGTFDISRYATKRIIRIVPAYIFVLALVVVGYFPGFVVDPQDLLDRVIYHLAFLQDVLPSDINVVFWSLGVEAKFYAVIPIFALLAIRAKRWQMVLAIGGAAVLLGPALRWALYAANETSDYYTFWRNFRSPFYACIEPFALGFLIAFFERKTMLRLPAKIATTLFCAGLIGLAAYLGSHVFLGTIGVWDATLQPTVLTLIFGALVVAAINMKDVQTGLAPAFHFGARISYALYLVHFPLIPLSISMANAYGLGVSGFWTIYIGLSVVHAVIILAYVEAPFMRSKQRRLSTTQHPRRNLGPHHDAA